ncbi:MAG TPA: alpha/beta hydrolase [Herpetosiphonaceae bacterium]
MIKRKASNATHPRRRVIWKILAVVVVVCLGLYMVMYDPHKIGYWRSAEGQQAYEAAYAEAMTLLPPPAQTYDIPTAYGTVRVYYWANEQPRSKTPAVFLPGRTSGVPMWNANLPAIAATRPVYALDALGDAGLSKQTTVLKDGADQAAWLDQVLSALELESVHLIGHSFGGWSAANYASRYPQRVATLLLLEPVFTFQGLKLEVYIKSIPASLPFLPKAWRDSFLKDIGGAAEIDLNDPMTRMIVHGTDYYAAKLPLPEQLSPEQMQSWNMPVFAAMAGKSALHDSRAAIVVANANVKHVQAKLWPDATHSLPMEVAAELNGEMISFMDANEPR